MPDKQKHTYVIRHCTLVRVAMLLLNKIPHKLYVKDVPTFIESIVHRTVFIVHGMWYSVYSSFISIQFSFVNRIRRVSFEDL